MNRLVEHRGLARLAVELESHHAKTVLVRRADVDQFDEQRLAFLDAHRDLLARFKPVKESRRGQYGGVGEIAGKPGEFGEDFGIHQVAEQIVVGDLAFEFGGQIVPRFFEIQWRHPRAGPATPRPGFAQHDPLQSPRPAPERLAQAAAEHLDHGLGKGSRAGGQVQHVRGLDAAGDQKHRHVADYLAARSHLHDVAKELVDFGVTAGDLRPAMPQTHRHGLFLEVGVLAAGHFVFVHRGAAAGGRGVERLVKRPDLLPVIGELIERPQVQAAVARGVLQGRHDRIQIGLAGGPGHRRDGQIDDVHAGVSGLQDGPGVDPAGVVSVEMDRQADLALQRFDQRVGRVRPAQARHVFDREEVRPHCFQLLGQLDVVL